MPLKMKLLMQNDTNCRSAAGQGTASHYDVVFQPFLWSPQLVCHADVGTLLERIGMKLR